MKGQGEDRLAAWLQGRLQAATQESTVQLRLHPQREGARNRSPDFVLELEVRVPLFAGAPLVVRAPLLVEVEAVAGVEGALLDLQRYVERSTDGSGRQPAAIELPFVVATGADGGARRTIERQLPVRFQLIEVPLPE
jgi:hypothetical protein